MMLLALCGMGLLSGTAYADDCSGPSDCATAPGTIDVAILIGVVGVVGGVAIAVAKARKDPCEESRKAAEDAAARALRLRIEADRLHELYDQAHAERQRLEGLQSWIEGENGPLKGVRLYSSDLALQRADEAAVRARQAAGEITAVEAQQLLAKWSDPDYVRQLAERGAAARANAEAQLPGAKTSEVQARSAWQKAEEAAKQAEKERDDAQRKADADCAPKASTPRTQERQPGDTPVLPPVTPPQPTPPEKPDPCGPRLLAINVGLRKLEALNQANHAAAEQANRAFYGDPTNPEADGYRHWIQQASVTEAVVDAENKVGKALIDAAYFAYFGLAGLKDTDGLGMVLSKMSAEILKKVDEEVTGSKIPGKAADYGSKFLGGIYDEGVLGKDSAFDANVGKIGMSLAKDLIVGALADWMKAGAVEGDLGRAKAAYAQFLGAATTANALQAAAAALRDQLDGLIGEARSAGCSPADIPDYPMTTYDVGDFGVGAFRGQAGPVLHYRYLVSGADHPHDMFAGN
jgi:hypothetical protein